jgi:uncharacterized protein YcsI (UPF0317 family)
MALGVAVDPTAALDAAASARASIRSGGYNGPTSALAPGCAQANLVVLPVGYAFDFLRFCVRNPRPCPILDVTDTGSPHPATVAPSADLRTDVPRYQVFRDGQLVDEPTDINRYWRSDLVAFLLGCSFTFDWALSAAGLRVAHQEQGVNVPMYVTNRACVGSGSFHGPMVVSMRPFPPAEVSRAVDISARYTSMHGAPVHVGDPDALGIADLNCQDYGQAVRISPGDVPVFWGCGVTPQGVVLQARPELAIFHAPGHMFITDSPHTYFDSGEDRS